MYGGSSFKSFLYIWLCWRKIKQSRCPAYTRPSIAHFFLGELTRVDHLVIFDQFDSTCIARNQVGCFFLNCKYCIISSNQAL